MGKKKKGIRKGKQINLEGRILFQPEHVEPEKPKVFENILKDIIKYNDRVFEVPVNVINYLSDTKKNLPGIIKRTTENGVALMYDDGVSGCPYCNYFAINPMEEALKSNGPQFFTTNGERGIYMDGCSYKRIEDVLWATSFEKIDSEEIVIAIKTPCVINDCIIIELVEKGLFDEYEVKDRKFNFLTVGDLLNKHELKKHYELQKR